MSPISLNSGAHLPPKSNTVAGNNGRPLVLASVRNVMLSVHKTHLFVTMAVPIYDPLSIRFMLIESDSARRFFTLRRTIVRVLFKFIDHTFAIMNRTLVLQARSSSI